MDTRRDAEVQPAFIVHLLSKRMRSLLAWCRTLDDARSTRQVDWAEQRNQTSVPRRQREIQPAAGVTTATLNLSPGGVAEHLDPIEVQFVRRGHVAKVIDGASDIEPVVLQS